MGLKNIGSHAAKDRIAWLELGLIVMSSSPEGISKVLQVAKL